MTKRCLVLLLVLACAFVSAEGKKDDHISRFPARLARNAPGAEYPNRTGPHGRGVLTRAR